MGHAIISYMSCFVMNLHALCINSHTMLCEPPQNMQIRFSGFNGAYHQINRSCKSDIPTKISRPFDLFETRLECMSLGHLGIIWDTRMRRNQIMRLAAVEIYNEITGYWLWPMATPDIEDVIDRSMRRVARLISKDYRAPIKVKCCGFTIFRCCCRKRNPKSNLLNKIADGLVDREKDMMYNRGVVDYVDRGEMNNRNGMVDDAYQAEQKLKRMEEGGSYYDDEYDQGSRSYYSRNSRSYDSRRGYSRRGGGDQQTIYTEDGDTYDNREYGLRRGDDSIDDSLTATQGWDEASASQY